MGIPAAVIDHRPHGEDRAAFESGAASGAATSTARRLSVSAASCGCLRRDFVLRWQGRMLNIHPSLLAAFRASIRMGRRCARASQISGATVHFVIPETDAGPIIAQAAVPVRDDDDVRHACGRASSQPSTVSYPAGARSRRGRTGQDRRRSLPDRRRSANASRGTDRARDMIREGPSPARNSRPPFGGYPTSKPEIKPGKRMTAITPTSRSATAGEPRPIIPPLAGFSFPCPRSLLARRAPDGRWDVAGPWHHEGHADGRERLHRHHRGICSRRHGSGAESSSGAGRGLCGVLSRDDRRSQ